MSYKIEQKNNTICVTDTETLEDTPFSSTFKRLGVTTERVYSIHDPETSQNILLGDYTNILDDGDNSFANDDDCFEYLTTL